LYSRLGGPSSGLDVCEIFRPPPGFDRRTVQLVASRRTDWAAPVLNVYKLFSFVGFGS
jgi:hypothetical protein